MNFLEEALGAPAIGDETPEDAHPVLAEQEQPELWTSHAEGLPERDWWPLTFAGTILALGATVGALGLLWLRRPYR